MFSAADDARRLLAAQGCLTSTYEINPETREPPAGGRVNGYVRASFEVCHPPVQTVR